MSNQIQIFNFQNNPNFPVKVIIQNNKEYFLAKNVCDILELANVSQALSRLEKEDIISNDTLTNGGIQKMSYVSEAGLYELVFASKKPEAKEFKKWVFNKVLPDIRKTGKFEVQQLTQKEQVLLLARNLLQAEEENQALKLENTAKEQIITEFIAIEGTKNYTESAKIFHILPQTFINWLKNNNYICKDRLPRQEYINRGYFVIKKTTNEVGRKCESYRITPKGFEYFAKKLNISK